MKQIKSINKYVKNKFKKIKKKANKNCCIIEFIIWSNLISLQTGSLYIMFNLIY